MHRHGGARPRGQDQALGPIERDVVRRVQLHGGVQPSPLPPITIQNDFGLLYRVFEGELAETCSRAHHNVSLLAYGVLNGGFLSGKYIRGDAEKTARFNFDQKFQPRYFHAPRRSHQGVHGARRGVRHGLRHPRPGVGVLEIYMGAVIIGATSLAQLEANWKAATTTLSDDTLAKIDAIHVKRRNPNLTD